MCIESKCRFSAPFSSRKSIRKGRQHQQLKTPAAISYIFIYKFYFLAAGFDDEFQCIIPATTTERRESRARNKQQQTHSMNSLHLLLLLLLWLGQVDSRDDDDVYNNFLRTVQLLIVNGANKIKLKSPPPSAGEHKSYF